MAAKKLVETGEVADRANVLGVPDLKSGHIACKLTQYWPGASTIGPFLQDLDKPISDSPRGASIDEIIATASVCLAQVG